MIKLLLIEDDPQIIKMYKRIFDLESIDCESAQDGEEGLEKSLSYKPDVILLDIMMPKMDGMQVLLRLKTNEITKNTPVVVLTNLAGTKDADSASYIGSVRYLVKSEYEPKQVVEIIKELVPQALEKEVLTTIQ